jgi:DNA primase
MDAVREYLRLMFSMKGLTKTVEFEHLRDKINRDVKKTPDAEIKKIIDGLVKERFLEGRDDHWTGTPEGREAFAEDFPKLEGGLRKINDPWVIVYRAKQYYPFVQDTVFDFCKDRMVGFYVLFTEKRFFRRDFKGKKIVLHSPKEIMFFADMHYIDIIPCVHRLKQYYPDWLVVDLDAGDKVTFEQTKQCAEATYKVFDELGLNPALKFSGSRGFQIWSWIKGFRLPEDYAPITLRSQTKRERNHFSLFADWVRLIQKEVDKEMPDMTTSDVSAKETRQEKILLDPSSMKPFGLVRSPYAVHSKTGLVSMPVPIKELDKFEHSMAATENVIERYKKKGNEFLLKPSDHKRLMDLF